MPTPIPASEYYRYTETTDIAISPDGRLTCFVADEFVEGENSRRQALFIVPNEAGTDPHRLTRIGEASDPVWGPEGERLAFLGTRSDDTANPSEGSPGSRSGDDTPDQPQLYLFDLERGGDARQITDRPEGVEEFDWSPDGQRIVSVSRDPTTEEREYLERLEDGGPLEIDRLQHKYDGRGWLDPVTRYLFVHDVDSGEERRLDAGVVSGTGTLMEGSSVSWSPDGSRIAFCSNRSDAPDDSLSTDIYTIAPDGTELDQRTDNQLLASELEWAPNSDRIAFKGQNAEDWYDPPELFLLTLPSEDTASLTRDLDRTMSRYSEPRWLTSDTLLTLVGDEGVTRFARVPTDGDASISFGRQGDHRTIDRFDHAAGVIVCRVSSPTDGTDLFTLHVDELDVGPEPPDPLQRLTSVNNELRDRFDEPGGCRRFTFPSQAEHVDGLVYYPSGHDLATSRPLPLILNVHGGPQSYDSPRYTFETGFWTSRGYLLANVNYRGSTSYGRDFCGALKDHWNDREVEDQLACVEYLVDAGWVDPERVFVTGFSYGGTSTAQLVARSDRFAAAAAEHGVYDLRSSFGTDDAHLWYENQYGLPWEDPDSWDDYSSILRVEDISVPTLVTAGETDWRCPPSQAEQLHVSLQKVGVESKLIIYHGEHHAVVKPERAIHRLEAIASWFETHDPGRRSDEPSME